MLERKRYFTLLEQLSSDREKRSLDIESKVEGYTVVKDGDFKIRLGAV